MIWRRVFREKQVIKRVAADLSHLHLFEAEEDADPNTEASGGLWDADGSVDDGINCADQR